MTPYLDVEEVRVVGEDVHFGQVEDGRVRLEPGQGGQGPATLKHGLNPRGERPVEAVQPVSVQHCLLV